MGKSRHGKCPHGIRETKKINMSAIFIKQVINIWRIMYNMIHTIKVIEYLLLAPKRWWTKRWTLYRQEMEQTKRKGMYR